MSFNNIRNPQLRRDLIDVFGDMYSYNTSTDTLTIANNVVISGSLSYGSVNVPVSQSLLGTLTVGISGTGYDVKFWGDTAGKYWLWDQDADGVVLVGTFTETGNMAVTGTLTITGNSTLIGTLTLNTEDNGLDVKLWGAAGSGYWLWDADADTNGGVVLVGSFTQTGAIDITGNAQLTGTLTVGVNETGHDVQFFGTTDGKYWLWDEDADGVVLVGTMTITGVTAIDGAVSVTGITNISNTTEASAVGTAALKTAGGLGVAKKAYIGTDLVLVAKGIDMSTAATGVYEITLKADQADALSIKDSTGDLMAFDTSDGALAITFTAAVALNGQVTLGDAINIALNTTTGTKIGTAVDQKLGFWNVDPVVQQASADQADQGAMTATLTGVDTGTDMTSTQAATIVADLAALDTLLTANRTALVNTGIMKGAA